MGTDAAQTVIVPPGVELAVGRASRSDRSDVVFYALARFRGQSLSTLFTGAKTVMFGFGKKDLVVGFGGCDKCADYRTLHSYNTWWSRVLMRCTECSRQVLLPKYKLADAIKGAGASLDQALWGLVAGERYVEAGPEQKDCMGRAGLHIKLLCCMNARGHVEAALRSLEKRGATGASQFVFARLLAFDRRIDESIEVHAQCSAAFPGNPFPPWAAGELCIFQGDLPRARTFIETAMGMAPREKRRPFLQLLLFIHEELQDYQRLADTYEVWFRDFPELSRGDKSFVEAYRGVCATCGRDPCL